MGAIEATTNIIVAMVNNKYICSPDEVSKAYKEIYKAIRNPQSSNN